MVVITQCYDSHAHFLASAILAGAFNLKELTTVSELPALVQKSHLPTQGPVFGFGWPASINNQQQLSSKILDQVFGPRVVVFSRNDGHAIWVSQFALEQLNLNKLTDIPKCYHHQIELHNTETISGVFYEDAAFWLWSQLIIWDPEWLKKQLLKAQDIWLDQGFTHVRDMTGNEAQYQALLELEKENQLQIYLLQNFEHFKNHDIAQTINQALRCQQQKSKHLKVGGVKIFLDGTLGAKTAALSHPYLGCDHGGQLLYTQEELLDIVTQVWQAGLDLCVHSLGDKATELITQVALAVWQQNGQQGYLHLEHVEICQPKTLKALINKPVTLHFQPSHWLDDHQGITQNLSPELGPQQFLWGLASQLGIKYYWGFDAPISAIGLALTYKALIMSAQQGVLLPKQAWYWGHQYGDLSWGSECVTHFDPVTQQTKIVWAKASES